MTFPTTVRAGTVRAVPPVARPPWLQPASLLAELPRDRDPWVAQLAVELRRAEGRIAVAAKALGVRRTTMTAWLAWLDEHEPDAAEKLPRATRSEAVAANMREVCTALDDAARAALAQIVEASGKVAVARDAGIGTRALNTALEGGEVKPATVTNLLALVAREAAKGARGR